MNQAFVLGNNPDGKRRFISQGAYDTIKAQRELTAKENQEKMDAVYGQKMHRYNKHQANYEKWEGRYDKVRNKNPKVMFTSHSDFHDQGDYETGMAYPLGGGEFDYYRDMVPGDQRFSKFRYLADDGKHYHINRYEKPIKPNKGTATYKPLEEDYIIDRFQGKHFVPTTGALTNYQNSKDVETVIGYYSNSKNFSGKPSQNALNLGTVKPITIANYKSMEAEEQARIPGYKAYNEYFINE